MINALLHAHVSLPLHVDPCYILSMVRSLRLLWVFGKVLGIDCGVRDDEDFCWPLLTFCRVVRRTQVGLGDDRGFRVSCCLSVTIAVCFNLMAKFMVC